MTAADVIRQMRDVEELRVACIALLEQMDKASELVTYQKRLISALKFDVVVMALQAGDIPEEPDDDELVSVMTLDPTLRQMVHINEETYCITGHNHDDGTRVLRVYSHQKIDEEGHTHG